MKLNVYSRISVAVVLAAFLGACSATSADEDKQARLEKLKEHHYTVIGLDEHADKTFGDLYKYERVVIVLGAEGPGIRRLIREHCDVLVTLPTQKPINSLNVSNAAAVALYALTA